MKHRQTAREGNVTTFSKGFDPHPAAVYFFRTLLRATDPSQSIVSTVYTVDTTCFDSWRHKNYPKRAILIFPIQYLALDDVDEGDSL